MTSIVMWLIFGFIGANMALAVTCVFQHSVKRLSGAEK